MEYVGYGVIALFVGFVIYQLTKKRNTTKGTGGGRGTKPPTHTK